MKKHINKAIQEYQGSMTKSWQSYNSEYYLHPNIRKPIKEQDFFFPINTRGKKNTKILKGD